MDETPARILVSLIQPGAKLPFRATDGASGFDLYACLPDGRPVRLGQRPTLVPTGIALEVPRGIDAQIRPRSGLARNGILSTFGTLDSDYRGEIMVALYTLAPDIEYEINDGDRIAQLVFVRLADVQFEQAGSLSTTVRGAGGHGSTGR